MLQSNAIDNACRSKAIEGVWERRTKFCSDACDGRMCRKNAAIDCRGVMSQQSVMECSHDRKTWHEALLECCVGMASVSSAQAGSYVLVRLAPQYEAANSARPVTYVMTRLGLRSASDNTDFM